MLAAAGLPELGTMKRDWMKEPRALTMSRNTLVECCFMSYDWQKDLHGTGRRHELCKDGIKLAEIVRCNDGQSRLGQKLVRQVSLFL